MVSSSIVAGSTTSNYNNFTDLSPALKSCFVSYSTSSCTRSIILAALSLITAFFALFRIVQLHRFRGSAVHHFLIHYTALLLCLLCAVCWLFPGIDAIDYTIAALMVLEYLIVFHAYWRIGRVVLAGWRRYFTLLFAMMFVAALINLGVFIADLFLSSLLFPHCPRLHYLCLSVTEFTLACLTLLVAFHICQRFLDFTMTHAMRAAQKFELFLIAIVFLISATLCLAFDAFVFATETTHYIPATGGKSVQMSDSASTVSYTTSTIAMLPVNGTAIIHCTEIHQGSQQAVFDTVVTIESIVRYLLPLWFVLYAIRPAQNAAIDYEAVDGDDLGANDSTSSPDLADDQALLVNDGSYQVDFRDGEAYQSGAAAISSDEALRRKSAAPEKRSNRQKIRSVASQSELGRSVPLPRPDSFLRTSESVSNDLDSASESYLVPARSYLPANRIRADSLRPEMSLVDSLRAAHQSQTLSRSSRRPDDQ